jgi:hypothetical protein
MKGIFLGREGVFPTCPINGASNALKTLHRSPGALFAIEQTFLQEGVPGREGGRFQMTGQGHSMAQESVQRIIHLLTSTEMSVAEIAERMACSKSAVVAINRKFQVREYSGLRTRWLKAEQKAAS